MFRIRIRMIDIFWASLICIPIHYSHVRIGSFPFLIELNFNRQTYFYNLESF
jgi:hypothetical protein